MIGVHSHSPCLAFDTYTILSFKTQSDENRIPTTSTDYASHLKWFFIRCTNANRAQNWRLPCYKLGPRSVRRYQVSLYYQHPGLTNLGSFKTACSPRKSPAARQLGLHPALYAEEETKVHPLLLSKCSNHFATTCWQPQSLCIQPARSWPSYLLRSSARCTLGTCSSLRTRHTPNCRQPSQEGSRSEPSQGDPSTPGSPVLTSKTTEGITKRMRDTLLNLKYRNATKVPRTLALLAPSRCWWACSL